MNTPTYKTVIEMPGAPVKRKSLIENEIDNFIPSNLEKTFDGVKTISFILKKKNKILNKNSSFFVEEEEQLLTSPVKSKRLLDEDHTPYDFEKRWRSDDDCINSSNLDYSKNDSKDDSKDNFIIKMFDFGIFNYYEYNNDAN